MDLTTIIGFIAATLTTAAFVPQAIKTYREKSAKDISLPMYLIFEMGIICWLIYGIALSDLPIILANCVTLIFSTMILVLKIRHG